MEEERTRGPEIEKRDVYEGGFGPDDLRYEMTDAEGHRVPARVVSVPDFAYICYREGTGDAGCHRVHPHVPTERKD